MTQPKDNRIAFIDLAKGMTMLTILWGHVMLTGSLNTIVYAFHIPVYFFLAGMVYRGEKYPTALALVKRRFVTLLVPYGFYSVVTWLWWLVDCLSKGISLAGCWRPLLQTILAQGSAGYMVHNPALWFVPCLFVVELMYYFISKLRPWQNLLACAVLAGLGWAMMQTERLKALPWSIEVACAAVIFYAAGNLLARKLRAGDLAAGAKKHPLMAAGTVVISFVLLCAGALSNGRVSMAQGFLGDRVLVFYPVAALGIVFVLSLSVCLEVLMGRAGFLDRIIGYFTWLGRNSFHMMVLHIPVMLVCVRLVAWASGQSLNDVRYAYRYTVPAWLGMVIGTSLLTAGIRWLKNKRKDPV